VLGLIALVLFAGVLFLLVRSVVSRPLARATEAADRIAKGDLDVHLKSTTRMKSAWCCAR
jgi:methyl-accepting chemotaxis protein-2 (aspartate sensor receptor)